MAKSKKRARGTDATVDILQKLLIAELALAGVRRDGIRQIVGCDVHRVSAVMRHISQTRKSAGRDSK